MKLTKLRLDESKLAELKEQFKIGNLVLHKAHGLGVISAVVERELSTGIRQSCFVLDIPDNGISRKVFVPVITALEKLRPIITPKEIERVYMLLKSKDIVSITHQTWNRRFHNCMDKIATGDPYEIAEVVKSLSILKKEVDLNFGERALLNQAKELLVVQIAFVQNVSECSIIKEIEAILA